MQGYADDKALSQGQVAEGEEVGEEQREVGEGLEGADNPHNLDNFLQESRRKIEMQFGESDKQSQTRREREKKRGKDR